mgnify:FL=1
MLDDLVEVAYERRDAQKTSPNEKDEDSEQNH